MSRDVDQVKFLDRRYSPDGRNTIAEVWPFGKVMLVLERAEGPGAGRYARRGMGVGHLISYLRVLEEALIFFVKAFIMPDRFL